jgi:hypothetical protein
MNNICRATAFTIIFFAIGLIIGCKTKHTETVTMKTPKEECEELMNVLTPFAEDMLKKYGEYFPFGASMKLDGEIICVEAYNGEEHPPSTDLVDLLTEGFQKDAKEGKIKASGIAYDVKVTPPDSNVKTDAICIHLDHIRNYSVEVFLPYQLTKEKELIYGEVFAQAGKHIIFGKK